MAGVTNVGAESILSIGTNIGASLTLSTMAYKTVIFTGDEVTSQGRNGLIRTTGVEIDELTDSAALRLTPINSKGITANCYIEIPREDIPVFLDALKAIYFGG